MSPSLFILLQSLRTLVPKNPLVIVTINIFATIMRPKIFIVLQLFVIDFANRLPLIN